LVVVGQKTAARVRAVPDGLFSHFVRGFLDGDGSISCNRRGKWFVSFYGPEDGVAEKA
jgi:intein-encoded DNA endonuclease-like protein